MKRHIPHLSDSRWKADVVFCGHRRLAWRRFKQTLYLSSFHVTRPQLGKGYTIVASGTPWEVGKQLAVSHVSVNATLQWKSPDRCNGIQRNRPHLCGWRAAAFFIFEDVHVMVPGESFGWHQRSLWVALLDYATRAESPAGNYNVALHCSLFPVISSILRLVFLWQAHPCLSWPRLTWASPTGCRMSPGNILLHCP